MGFQNLEEHIRDKQSTKDSTDDQVIIANILYKEELGPTSDGIKRKELEDKAEKLDVELEYSIGTSLKNLREINVVKRWIKGPQFWIIHERLDDIVNGEDLEQLVNEEVERLIQDVQEDDTRDEGDSTPAVADGGDEVTRRDIVAQKLEIDPADVEEELRDGEVPDRMSDLEDAIEAIEDHPDVEKNGEYGPIVFRHNAYLYALTGNAMSLASEEESES